jgi:hypothetical protein
MKQQDGTTGMIKYLIPAFLCVIFAAGLFNPAESYWAQVGYNMDFTLNPCNYIYCGE